jgi:hypothetical protein
MDLFRERRELKYLPDPRETQELRKRMEEAGSSPGFKREEGWVTTVYLDRPDGSLSRKTLGSPAECVKVRLREYLTGTEGIYLELKERRGWLSRKSRVVVSRREVGAILRGQGWGAGATWDRIREVAGGPMRAVGAVRYRRLAVEGGTPRARVTLDELIRYHLELDDLDDALGSGALGPVAIREAQAVGELKFAGSHPAAWCERMIAGLSPAEYSKFRAISALALSETVAAGCLSRS